jgi:hypothetical protein
MRLTKFRVSEKLAPNEEGIKKIKKMNKNEISLKTLQPEADLWIKQLQTVLLIEHKATPILPRGLCQQLLRLRRNQLYKKQHHNKTIAFKIFKNPVPKNKVYLGRATYAMHPFETMETGNKTYTKCFLRLL